MDENKKKMLEGKIYDPFIGDLQKERINCHNLCLEYNQLKDLDPRKDEIIKILFPDSENLYLQGPIFFDFGTNTHFGKNCYANFNFIYNYLTMETKIVIKGAKENNLKNIDLELPKNSLIVFYFTAKKDNGC